jgi:CTP synthase
MKKVIPKYIFVVGGVISGVGKGITASSIAKILQDNGTSVTAIKIDPYVNIDAGTMNPTEHGEVFVTRDGDECDQDMGNYERFLNIDLTRINYMTTGRVYQSVIENERALKYKGACVQVVPHIPLEIFGRIERAQKNANAEVTVIEIGGTVGEYENILFLEAARMLKLRHPDKVMFVMVSYLPTPSSIGEMKTKPTQHSVRTLNSSGIQPDIIMARSKEPLDEKRKEKLSFFCNVPKDQVISAPDVDSIYDIPVNFEKEGLSKIIAKLLHIKFPSKKLNTVSAWKKMVNVIHNAKDEVRIAIVGKYFDSGEFTLTDSYLSVIEALKYSAYALGKKPIINWVNALEFEKNPKSVAKLRAYHGVIVPGGFGSRGIEGKIMAIEYVRKNNIPYLGLCYGMQLAVIEYARHMAGIKGATSRELDAKGKECVIDVMDTQKEILKKEEYGGSMRLGSYECFLKKGSIVNSLYKNNMIVERHRHRFEVSPLFIERLEDSGLVFSGVSPDGTLMEIIELSKKTHPFFVGCQFHPEFQARPLSPHPLFTGFIKASLEHKNHEKRNTKK